MFGSKEAMKALKIAVVSPLVIGIGQDPNTYSSQQLNLALCWAEAGHHVDIITGRQKGLSGAISHKRIQVFQHRLIWVGMNAGFALLCGGVRRLLKNRYDMVFASEHYHPSTLLTCLLSKNTVIYQGQNTAGSTSARRVIMWFFDKMIIPIVRRRYRKIIAKTRSAEAFVRQRGFDKCTTIPCGYDPARFRYPSASERNRSRVTLDIADNARVLVYAGNLIPRRDVATALYALKELHKTDGSVKLLIAGDGSERPALENLSSAIGVQSAVRFLGRLNWLDLRNLFWAGDIFVFPTRYEIFGLVLIEALASGMKIVSTPCPAAEDILSEAPAAGAIVQIGAYQRMAAACSVLFENQQTSYRSDAALEGFITKMTWCKIADRILEAV
jgi:glycosyltransferase involved in cell wall biosynthesis